MRSFPSRSFASRLAALEALEAAQRPDAPAFVCMHQVDYAALNDVATPADVKRAIARAYGLAGQKIYVDLCGCDPGESCRVCRDEPLIAER